MQGTSSIPDVRDPASRQDSHRLLRRRLLAANLGALALLLVAVAANTGPVRVVSGDLPAGPVVVRNFEVTDDLSTARIDLAIRTEIVSDAGHLDDQGLTLPLAFSSELVMQATTAVLRSGGAVVGKLTVEYYPRSLYEGLGTSDPGFVILVTDLPRQGLRRAPPATAAPLDPAVVSLAATEVGRIESLNRTDSGHLCTGSTGSALMAEMATGNCFVWCTGRAIILRDALRDAGFEARVDYLEPDMRTLRSGIVRESSESHATVETRGPTGWQWIGPTNGLEAGGLSLDAFLATRDTASLVHYVNVGDPTVALERYLTADKLVVPEP